MTKAKSSPENPANANPVFVREDVSLPAQSHFVWNEYLTQTPAATRNICELSVPSDLIERRLMVYIFVNNGTLLAEIQAFRMGDLQVSFPCNFGAGSPPLSGGSLLFPGASSNSFNTFSALPVQPTLVGESTSPVALPYFDFVCECDSIFVKVNSVAGITAFRVIMACLSGRRPSPPPIIIQRGQVGSPP